MNEAIERLYRRRRFGMKPGLEIETALLERLGNPHRRYLSVHIAGTNGKGSVAAMLDCILSAAGYRTGRYTSPHLVHFNERFCINGQPIDDDKLARTVELVEALSTDVGAVEGKEPTFFECSTAIAFSYFGNEGVDVAILETGMGGRLDATNVVTPLLSVITRIGIEHAAFLGHDLETIAGEKAGIIKPGRPVVCGAMDATAAAVVRRTANDLGAVFVDAAENVSIRIKNEDLGGQTLSMDTDAASYGAVRLPLVGRHQAENAATAVATADALVSLCGMEIDERAVKKGLESVQWPGRFQLIRESPPVILDGAHNPDAARALAATVRKLAAKRPVGLVVGMCADKDAKAFLSAFGGGVDKLWVVPIRNERCMSPQILRSVGSGLGMDVEETDLVCARESAVQWASDRGGVVCITGSLFLVGEVLEIEARDVQA